MKKSILNLAGAQELTKNEQKSINGGLKHTCKGGAKWCSLDSECYSEFVNTACINGCCQVVL